MSQAHANVDFHLLWRNLQQAGLNAYEARAYLVLLGHPRFKALELAARARVPRQKIYEVLESLVAKGFAQVVRGKTKLFNAVEPAMALACYLECRRQEAERELARQERVAAGLLDDLRANYAAGLAGRGTLDFLQIITEPAQSAAHYRRLLREVKSEYLEFSRPPYAVDVVDEDLVKQARLRGVACRVLVDPEILEQAWKRRLESLEAVGVEVHQTTLLPLKLALFDGCRGLIALLDPVVTNPSWTALVFEHPSLGEAMRGLFEQHWISSGPLDIANGPD